MTTALGIKCSDGIVLASDSQGTQNDSKRTIEKVFKINESVGLVGARDYFQVKDLVKHFEKIPENFKDENELENHLNKLLFELHKEKNEPEYAKIDLNLSDSLYFSPEVLIGTKLTEKESRLHYGEFYIEQETVRNRSLSRLKLIDDYLAIGHGYSLVINHLEQINTNLKLNKKISELPVEVNIGLAMYAIGQAKETDLYSGGDTQIGVIDSDGFRKISVDDQTPYYHKMITYLSDLLNEDEPKIREWLPVSRTILLD